MILICTKEYPELAQAEIEVLGTRVKKLYDHVYSVDEIDYKRLAYVRYVLEEKYSTELEKDWTCDFVKDQYKVLVHYVQEGPSVGEVADLIWDGQHGKTVDVHHPQHTYMVVWAKTKYIGELVYANTEDFSSRKSHNLSLPHPTGMDPRIARSLINLSGKNSFYDPFCGAGGILLEGKEMGLEVSGSDIDKIMVKRAKQNTGLDVVQLDAFDLEGRFEAIVTDLPYGKNSITSEDIVSRFLEHAKKLTDVLVVGAAEDIDVAGWNVQYTFEIYIHKSLTRRFYVLHQ